MIKAFLLLTIIYLATPAACGCKSYTRDVSKCPCLKASSKMMTTVLRTQSKNVGKQSQVGKNYMAPRSLSLVGSMNSKLFIRKYSHSNYRNTASITTNWKKC